jgi:hypothetical protein
MPTDFGFGVYSYGDPERSRRERQKREASRARKWKAMQDAMATKRKRPTSEGREDA